MGIQAKIRVKPKKEMIFKTSKIASMPEYKRSKISPAQQTIRTRWTKTQREDISRRFMSKK